MAISLRTPSQNGGKRGVAASAVSVDYILRKPRVPRIKSAPPHWDSHLTHSSLGLASLLLSNASRSVNPFSRSSPLYPRDIHTDHSASDTIRYEMLFERAFNSYISQLNLPHGAKKIKSEKGHVLVQFHTAFVSCRHIRSALFVPLCLFVANKFDLIDLI